MAITFSFKTKKDQPKEKYEFPVMTQKAYSGEKNAVARFEFNKAALTALGYPEDLTGCKMSVGMANGMLAIVNTTGMETDHQYNVNKGDGSVNSKFLLTQIIKHFEIDTIEDNEFKLIINDDDDVKYAHLDPNVEIVEVEEVTDAVGEIVDTEEFYLPSDINETF